MTDKARQVHDRRTLRNMTPDQVRDLFDSGALDDLANGVDLARGHALNASQWNTIITGMSDSELSDADQRGDLDALHTQARQQTQAPTIDQGARTGGPSRDRASLKTMHPQQIADALDRGEYDALLRGD